MTVLLCLLQSISALVIIHAPPGTQLYVRMTTPVASWSSATGTPVSAVLIAPVIVNGQSTLQAGSTLSGQIKSVTRVGLGIRHERASLRLEFTSLTPPDGEKMSLSARVTQVDNGRERVTSTGLIQGVRATASISYRVSGYIKTMLLWHFHAELAEWAIKSLIAQLPEPEIYYPAGTELTLRLTRKLLLIARARRFQPVQPADQLLDSDLTDLRRLAASMPFRTSEPESGRPSDPTNVLLVGSRSQILDGFHAAGWSAASPDSIRFRIGYIRAAAEVHGYPAPMSSLLLNGVEADMSLQKGLNDVSKRHHIRIWKQPDLWKGQELWMAAATRDIDFAYLRPGHVFTHRIAPNVDEERDKVAYDLAFTSCASPIAWIGRLGVPSSARNGTGDSIATDTRLVTVRFKDCSRQAATDWPPLIVRGGRWQRFARREILITRSDLMRANPYWRAYEAARWTFDFTRRHRKDVRSEPVLADSAPADFSSHRQTLSLALSSLK